MSEHRGSVVTVGTFDGVHLGHQDVLARLVARGLETNRTSVVVTFEPHPLEIVNPGHAPPLLTLHDEKLEQFARAGVSRVVILPFTPALAALEAGSFVDKILRDRLDMGELLVGHDHGFGRDRMGDVNVLRSLASVSNFEIAVLDPVHASNGERISSTAIRSAVANGDLARAHAGLGRCYGVRGTIVGGERRGRLMGYPTINVSPPSERKLLPPDGVYAVTAHMPAGSFHGMLNLGPRPTFDDSSRRMEAHLFDASGDWYGSSVMVEFVERLRGVRRFDSPEQLSLQLADDEKTARKVLAQA